MSYVAHEFEYSHISNLGCYIMDKCKHCGLVMRREEWKARYADCPKSKERQDVQS